VTATWQSGDGRVALYCGDALATLRELPAGSVHCCVTSPPYWGLRSYCGEGTPEKAHEMGLEPDPTTYVAGMVAVFAEVRRVLRDDGTLWLNLGDSYVANGSGQVPQTKDHKGSGFPGPNRDGLTGLAPKNLVGIPWRVAFALQADGWYLRQDIIWHKPNPMPESVTDRCTKAHEYMFLLSKSARYWYDAEAIKEPCESGPSDIRKMEQKLQRFDAKHFHTDPGPLAAANPSTNIGNKRAVGDPSGRNRRSVWTIATAPYSGAHFATFPPKLIEPCILAGCPDRCCPKCGAGWERIIEKSGGSIGHGSWTCHDEKDAERGMVQNQTAAKAKTTDGSYTVRTVGFRSTCGCGDTATVPGVVLDPFGGSGTTGAVAVAHGRRAVLIELKPDGLAQARVGEACELRRRADAQPCLPLAVAPEPAPQPELFKEGNENG
jgi:DNA modification methylase